MPYRLINAVGVPLGRGPHPAASPFDRRMSEELGLTGFEAYQVELPPGGETVQHDHVDDQVEDMYALLQGDGSVIVDGKAVTVSSSDFVSVALESQRFVRAGDNGLVFIAICAPRAP